jgi:hypothetical protein
MESTSTIPHFLSIPEDDERLEMQMRAMNP